MNNRIALVLKAKNISPSQLADDLGVQRSGISHIINGRNKPSLEFVQKLIKLYPDISIQWILFGEGPMMNPYPGGATIATGSERLTEVAADSKPKPMLMELFSTMDDTVEMQVNPEGEKPVENLVRPLDKSGRDTDELIAGYEDRKIAGTENPSVPAKNNDTFLQPGFKDEPAAPEVTGQSFVGSGVSVPEKAGRRVTKILVFYNDRTFVEYMPGVE